MVDPMLMDCQLALERDKLEADGRSRSKEGREECDDGLDDLFDGKDGVGDDEKEMLEEAGGKEMASPELVSAGGNTLSATILFIRRWRARKTTPMPPSPNTLRRV